MKHTTMTLKNFTGTNYEVGGQIGQWVMTRPDLLQRFIMGPDAFPADKLAQIEALLDRYCPGVNEEIQGFADTLRIDKQQAVFYMETYLERGCSLTAALPSRTADGRTLMARSYDFNDDIEEMCFAYTAVDGAFRHVGSTLNLFGRCDGINEHGLAVAIASNGLPVGNFPGGTPAGATGFSFWVVVRSVLEQCATVDEAVAWTMEAPVGFNINLLLADASDRIGLVQCIDGHKACTVLDAESTEDHLSTTNHAVLPDVKRYEHMLLENSVIRYDAIERLYAERAHVSEDDLKGLLSTSYPDGLCCHFYPEFFGTLRSMVFDPAARAVETTFGSPQENGWQRFTVEPLEEREVTVNLPCEKMPAAFAKTL